MNASAHDTGTGSCPVVDLQNRPGQLRDALYGGLRAHPDRLLVEAAGMETFDNASLAVFVVAIVEARRQGTRISLVDPTPAVREMLDLTAARWNVDIVRTAVPVA